ncbi:MAG: FtsX-like permease family protein [Bacteroidales bacterium]|nr:FtsX-like permease family protein [Bacteroidales bacterium]
MIRFLIIGLLRDKSRSRLPIIVVAIGVMLTVFMHAYITGFMGDTIEMNANFANGHVKIMTRAYAENMDQMPNDLALLETDQLLEELQTQFGSVDWAPRIRFGGLLDVPDEQGETRSQGPVFGLGLDFLSPDSREAERLNIDHALVRGQKLSQPGEALISDLFAQKMHLNIGDTVTLIGSTMNGSMAFYNFTVAGTLSFGSEALDRGALLVDYNDETALAMSEHFNQKHAGSDDAFAPVMKSLSQQGSMGLYVSMAAYWSLYISLVFVLSMALVLWNAGLLGSLRRYGEFGVRLAMGEAKDHVYITLIYEAIAIGISGTIIGTAFGLLFAWLLQTYGLNISGMMEGASLMMPSTIRARITAESYYLGFIPGLLSTVAGTMLAGIGIYRRQTSQLFKELET